LSAQTFISFRCLLLSGMVSRDWLEHLLACELLSSEW
jgi:hypothetical protein